MDWPSMLMKRAAELTSPESSAAQKERQETRIWSVSLLGRANVPCWLAVSTVAITPFERIVRSARPSRLESLSVALMPLALRS